MKYHNRKTTVNGIVFDSAKEARRYLELLLLERAGEISHLKRQVKFELIPAQYVDGKCVERAVVYIADFVYHDFASNEVIVEDVKGAKTKDYIIKRKLMLHKHGVQITEV